MSNITKVYLLDVPLENDYKHTLYFEDKNKQSAYFSSKVVWYFDDFSYQRKDNYIRVPKQYDELLNCNYVMYQNKAYNNKWFYAFITDLKYISDDRTDIYIETDVMQTYMFDYSFNECFIEREHVDDDTIGLHTLPENLETGDYIGDTPIKYRKLTYRGYIVGATVDLENSSFPAIEGEIYNGIYSGVRYFYYTSASEIGLKLSQLAEKGKADSIVSIFIVPKEFISHTNKKVNLSFSPVSDVWSGSVYADNLKQEKVLKPSDINGYSPKNNKLFVYPYTYLLMSNNSGGSAVYKYELFDTDICDFIINFAITPGCSIRLIPRRYNGVSENNLEGLTGGKFPACSWANDVYTNWLTQNSVNIKVTLANGALQAITGTVSGAVSGAVSGGAMAGVPGAVAGGIAGGVTGMAGGVTSIASTVGEVYAHSLQPPQAEGNINSGDVTFSNGDLTFTAYPMSIKREYAEIIDKYFTMFGYQVNRVGEPLKNHRKLFWFTKTNGCEIDGAIPNNDIQKIKQCYDNGITFWRNENTMNLYYLDNGIL